MTESLPEPLLPDDVDLSDFAFMPLEVARLRRSRQWLLAKRRPEIGFYSINLWTAAWHERPAGSLEDDDDVLADAALCAPDKWVKVKEDVLRGWIRCSDGRLYHPIVCEKAAEAWEEKGLHRWRKECDRVRKENKRRKDRGDTELPLPPEPERKSGGQTKEFRRKTKERPTEPEMTSHGIPAENLLKGQGQGQGQGQGLSSVSEDGNGRRAPPSAGIQKPPDPDAELFDRGKSILGKSAGGQIAKLKALFGGDVAKTRAYIEEAATKQSPGEYVAATIRKHAGKAPPPSGGLDFTRFPANGLYDTSI